MKRTPTAIFISIILALALAGGSVLSLMGCASTGNGRTTLAAADYKADNAFMQMAIEEARDGIYNGDGGPFGAVIVKEGNVVGSGHNCVLANNDSTCHGEVAAIRAAEQALQSYDLTGCVLYTTGEPCMMCLAACLWANVDHVCYGCTIEDNSTIGFRDEQMDQLIGNRDQLKGEDANVDSTFNSSDGQPYLEQMDREACLKLFEEYNRMDKIIY